MSTEPIVLATLLVLCSVYALWLSINGKSKFGGKRWADHATWVTVVVGVAGVILVGALADPHDETEKWILRFIVAGSPLIFRSIAFDVSRWMSLQNKVND